LTSGAAALLPPVLRRERRHMPLPLFDTLIRHIPALIRFLLSRHQLTPYAADIDDYITMAFDISFIERH
jgi:hypothetical protein